MIGILLAAGFSRRFGDANKLCQPLDDGEWMAVHAAKRLLTVLPHSLAVVRAQPYALQARLAALGLQVVVCPDQAQTMADSMVHAVTAAQQHPESQGGLMIALADMPRVQAATILAVKTAIAQGALIARPSVNGVVGHPVAFAASMVSHLLAVQGDQGARSVLAQFAAQVHTVPVRDAGACLDIDVPADLQRLYPAAGWSD